MMPHKYHLQPIVHANKEQTLLLSSTMTVKRLFNIWNMFCLMQKEHLKQNTYMHKNTEHIMVQIEHQKHNTYMFNNKEHNTVHWR